MISLPRNSLLTNCFLETQHDGAGQSAPSPTIHTGGGTAIGGDATVGGDLVGRDKVIHGDVVQGDKVAGDKVAGDKVVHIYVGAYEPATDPSAAIGSLLTQDLLFGGHDAVVRAYGDYNKYPLTERSLAQVTQFKAIQDDSIRDALNLREHYLTFIKSRLFELAQEAQVQQERLDGVDQQFDSLRLSQMRAQLAYPVITDDPYVGPVPLRATSPISSLAVSARRKSFFHASFRSGWCSFTPSRARARVR